MIQIQLVGMILGTVPEIGIEQPVLREKSVETAELADMAQFDARHVIGDGVLSSATASTRSGGM